jgi:hypothetical protein
MQAAGLAAYRKRTDNRSRIYSFEQHTVRLSTEFEKIFRENKKAWKFFESQVPSYRRLCIHWVMSARQEVTRKNRFNTLIKDSGNGKFIAPMRWNKNMKEKKPGDQ